MKMHPSHRPCLLALAALPARSRTIDFRGNVTHTGNLGSVPSRWLGGSVVRWLGSCANPQPETHTSRPENEGLVPNVPILKYRIIHKGQAIIMQIACAVAGSVPRFSNVEISLMSIFCFAYLSSWPIISKPKSRFSCSYCRRAMFVSGMSISQYCE